jgi:protocatechuate 3,4-dioxygenase beta subunit
MSNVSRRQLLTGLAALGAGGSLVLRAGAEPTPEVPDVHGYEDFIALRTQDKAPLVLADTVKPTEDCILGPYYLAGAPFRGKVTRPFEPGTVLVIRGRVWGFDTKKPLAGAQLDVWQADAKGVYDDDPNPDHRPKPGTFVNRIRLVTDEAGLYEYETVHPGAYQIGPNAWRPSHIHYLIQAPKYKRLITQLFFKGDKHNATDDFIKDSLIIDVKTVKVGDNRYEAGTFDIVLAPS